MSQRYQERSFLHRFAIVSLIGIIAVACVLCAPLLGFSVKHVALPILLIAVFFSNGYLEREAAPISAVLPVIQAVAHREIYEQRVSTRVVWQSPTLSSHSQQSTAFAACHVAFAVCLALPVAPMQPGTLQGGTTMTPVQVIVVNESATSVHLKVSRRDEDA